MWRLVICCLTAVLPWLCGASAAALTLVRDGQPCATIVLADKPNRAAQFAAYELQWHVQQMTGATLPIVHEGETISGARVLVGDSGLTRRLGLWNAGLANQEYVVRFGRDALVLMGRDKVDKTVVQYAQRPSPEALATWPDMWDEIGTVYAVHDFLAKSCGVRWLNHTEFGTVIPQRKTLSVSGPDIHRKPAFSYRYACYLGSENYDRFVSLQPRTKEDWDAFEGACFPTLRKEKPDRWQYLHAKRGYVNLFRLRMKDGGHKCVGNHSLYGYYDRFWEPNAGNPKLFEAKHPDWFARGPQGTPGYEGRPPQMCYTSRGLIEQVAKDAREYFDTGKSYPGSQNSEEFFCVEPMDNAQFCQCPACQALINATTDERGEGCYSNGRHSDYFFHFVNEVAKEVRKTHPDKYIVTLSYMTHAWPPKTFRLEPNVAVQFCFACNRMPYSRAQYANELRSLDLWARQAKERPLYLWLYYTFPVEIAVNGKFHCFPGAFAHTIGDQMKLFAEKGYRGMFHCGYGQEVEAYVTYRLMDDPSLNVDKLLDEYFTGLYGKAGAPLLRMYLDMERTYCDPANYPPSPGHQSVDIAWGKLGTPERMARYQQWVDEAKRLAQTDREKKNVELFELGTWQYMKAGADQFRLRSVAPLPSVSAPQVAAAGGDAGKVDWAKAAELTGGFHERGSDKAPGRKLTGRVAHDGKFVYLQLTDPCDPSKLVVSPGVFPFDTWEIFVAAQRAKPYRQFGVGPSGTVVALTNGESGDGSNVALPDHGITVATHKAGGAWTTAVAIPFATLSQKGLPDSRKLYVNVVRVTNPSLSGEGRLTVDSWVSYATVHTVDRLAEITLQ